MNVVRRALALAVCLGATVACETTPDDLASIAASPTAMARAARLQHALADGEGDASEDTPVAEWLLPHELQEISGLALSGDGRLFAHDDEVGQVWEIDYRRGIVVKRFSLGPDPVKADFEGITIANDVMYMLSSHGKLFSFREGANNARVPFTRVDTGHEKDCEFEGVAFDSTLNALLFACKNVLNHQLKGSLVIYRWSLKGDSSAALAPLIVPLATIIGGNGWKTVRPSDITVDPTTGNYVLVASQDNAMFSITPAGALVFARPLSTLHHQAEGVAITKDSVLIVSDEAGKQPAIITLYRWR